jgi:hypothetical protein
MINQKPRLLFAWIGVCTLFAVGCVQNRTPFIALNTTASTCFLSAAGDPGLNLVMIEDVLRTPTADYSGNWVQKMVRVSVTSAPLVGEVSTTMTSFMRVQLNQDGTLIHMDSELCGLVSESDTERIITVIPQALVDAIPLMERTGQIGRIGESHVMYWPTTTEIRGARLENRWDLLPEDDADPRLVDQDGDGYPGITIGVEGMVTGEMYVVQRLEESFCGVSNGVDEMNGVIEWQLNQVVLGASNFMLNRQTDALPHADPLRHNFQSIRVETMPTCEELIFDHEEIFGLSSLNEQIEE